VVVVPPIRNTAQPESGKTRDAAIRLTSPEEYMNFAREHGIMVKDNREKGGCLWIQSDPRIDGMIKD